MRVNRFVSTSRLCVVVIRTERRAQRRLVAAEYRSILQERCLRPTPDHRHRRRTLAWRYQTWNHQHWFMCYLLMNPGSAFTILMAVPKFGGLLVKGSWIVASKEQISQPNHHGMGCFPSGRIIRADGGGWYCFIHILCQNLLPWTCTHFQRNIVFVHVDAHWTRFI